MKTRVGVALCATCLILVWGLAYKNRKGENVSEAIGLHSYTGARAVSGSTDHQMTEVISRIRPRVDLNRKLYEQFGDALEEAKPYASMSRTRENVNSKTTSPVVALRPPTNLSIDNLENISRLKQPQKPIPNRHDTTTSAVQHDKGVLTTTPTTTTPPPPAHSGRKATPHIQKTTSAHPKCPSNEQAKTKSSVFSSKSRADVPVFLNRVNSSVTGTARKWWFANMHKQDSGLEGVISGLLKVVPGKHSFRNNNSECISCAIVGNAGNLHGSGYGKFIDSRHVIIRSNVSPTKGFEQDVGSRTTHQILYPESATSYHPGVPIIFLPFKTQDLRWLRSIFTTKDVTGGFWRGVPRSLNGAKAEETFIIHPAFLHYVQLWLSSPRGKWPSAGDVSLILGLHMCDELHVMGFGLNKYGRWDHYYEAKVGQDAGLKPNQIYHPVDQEATLRKQLVADGIITLYPGGT